MILALHLDKAFICYPLFNKLSMSRLVPAPTAPVMAPLAAAFAAFLA